MRGKKKERDQEAPLLYFRMTLFQRLFSISFNDIGQSFEKNIVDEKS